MYGRFTRTHLAAKESTIFVLLMKVFLLHESCVYRQLACPMCSLMMKKIRDSYRENIKIMKAMSVIFYYGSFMFSTMG